MTTARVACFFLLVSVVALVAYAPALQSEAFWEYDVPITQNRQMHSLGGLLRIWFEPFSSPHYYPMVSTVFWILNRLFGDWIAGYHFVSILLHSANAVLVYIVGVRLGVRFAWLGAFLFLLHPVNVQSVVWVEMNIMLSTFFMLVGCLVWTGGQPKEAPHIATARWLVMAAIFAAATFTSSMSLIMLPVLLIADWALGRGIKHTAYWIALAPFIVTGVVFAILYIPFGGSPSGEGVASFPTLLEQVGLASWSLFFYLGKLAWPFSLAPAYAVPTITPIWGVFWTACSVFFLIVAFYWGRIRSWRPMAAVALYASFLVPLPFIQGAFTRWHAPVADHFAYVPSIVFCLAMSSFGWRLSRGSASFRIFTSVGLAACLLFGVLTWRYAQAWRTGEAWEKASLNAPLSPAALNHVVNLAVSGREQEALPVVAKLYENPQYQLYVARAYASLLAQIGMTKEAEIVLREALLRRPGDLQLWLSLGKLFANSGRPAEAVEALTLALPANPANRIALASALVRAGRINEARAEVAFMPAPTRSNADALADLAADFSEVGAFAEAESIFSSILKRFPIRHRIRLALAYVLLRGGKIGEAHEQFAQVASSVPGDSAAIIGYTECLLRIGRADKAAHLLETTILNNPSADVRNAYAWFLATCSDATQRNAAKALEQLYAIDEVQLAGSAYFQGTLAASLAASGRFVDAVAAAERALALAQNSRDENFVAGTRERLNLYRAGQAYIQSAPPVP
jgi:predicted Zn-dependent protease